MGGTPDSWDEIPTAVPPAGSYISSTSITGTNYRFHPWWRTLSLALTIIIWYLPINFVGIYLLHSKFLPLIAIASFSTPLRLYLLYLYLHSVITGLMSDLIQLHTWIILILLHDINSMLYQLAGTAMYHICCSTDVIQIWYHIWFGSDGHQTWFTYDNSWVCMGQHYSYPT